MRERFYFFWDAIRSSYLTLPLLFCTFAALLSVALPVLDQKIIESSVFTLPNWMYLPANTLRAVLPTIGGSMLSITGTVFSIIIVVLSLTSSQFGPRLLRSFMEDSVAQITLGVFLSTSLYSLLLLPYVGLNDQRQQLALSCTVALLLVIASIFVFIYFVHHIAVAIQAPTVVHSVAYDLQQAITRLTREKDKTETTTDDELVALPEGESEPLRLGKEGYVISINEDAMAEVARRHNALLSLRVRPGHFISAATIAADVWWQSSLESGKRSKEEAQERFAKLAAEVATLVLTGARRSPRNDLECTISELVEFAVRALSPGINDPFTATTVIDKLGAALAHLSTRRFLPTQYFDENKVLRLSCRRLEFSSVLEASFNQIRQAGRGDISVSARILEALLHIELMTEDTEILEAIRLQAEAVYFGCQQETEMCSLDRKAIQTRYELLRSSIKEETKLGFAG